MAATSQFQQLQILEMKKKTRNREGGRDKSKKKSPFNLRSFCWNLKWRMVDGVVWSSIGGSDRNLVEGRERRWRAGAEMLGGGKRE